MSSSRKEEERNEKIIRGLLKLPPNRRCINCNSVGPQYVCTNFWTFVCIACSGIHREFTHRVKSVSMAKFTSQEVEALQKGGNQRAREIYLRDWDPQQQRLPDSSNPDRVRDFIKSVYVDKKYGGGKASDKPPRDLQSQKSLEDDLRRASSYHSYSQSPPYDNQYEERRYGKQAGVLTRRPGSDRGHYYDGKLSSFIYSPGRSGEQMSEDRFSNEGFSSRASDFSVSSGGDPFRSGAQSPTLQKEIGFNSPPAQSGRNFTSEDLRRQSISVHSDTAMKRDVGGIPRPQRTASSGSFGSFDSNTVYRKSVSSGCLADTVLEPEQSQSLQSYVSAGMAHWDPFGPSVQSVAASSSSAANIFSNVIHQPVSEAQTPEALLVPSIDLFPGSSNPPLPSTLVPSTSLFAGITQQPLTYVEQQVSASPSTVTEGWATFDLPQHATSTSETKQESATNATATGDALPEVNLETLTNGNNVMLSPVQSSVSHGPFPMTTKQGVSEMLLPSVSFNEAKQESVQMMSSDNELKSGNIEASAIADPKLMAIDGHFFPSVADQLHKFSDSMQPSIAPASFQSWNAFEDSFGSIPEPSFHTLNRSIEPQGFFERPSTSDNEIPKPPEDSLYSGFEINSISSSGLRSHIGGVSNGAFHLSGELSSHAHEHKSINPFDLPNDLEAESSNWFYDMSSLQAALPDPSLPLTYGADLTHPWLPQSSLVPYIPPVPQESLGGLTYMPAQMQPQLPNHSAQSSMASLGGNPFA